MAITLTENAAKQIQMHLIKWQQCSCPAHRPKQIQTQPIFTTETLIERINR